MFAFSKLHIWRGKGSTALMCVQGMHGRKVHRLSSQLLLCSRLSDPFFLLNGEVARDTTNVICSYKLHFTTFAGGPSDFLCS